MIIFIVVSEDRFSRKHIESVWDNHTKAHEAIRKYEHASKLSGEKLTKFYIITRDMNVLNKSVLEQG